MTKSAIVMNVDIRKTDDYNNVLKVAESSKRYFETGFEQLKKDIRNHLLFGAYLDSKVIGFIAYKENSKDVTEISWLAVSPEYRHKGIGNKLVLESLKLLKGDYKICEVKTLAEIHKDPGYAETRKFYKKLGFISLETIHPYPGWDKDSPCQIFVKPLK